MFIINKVAVGNLEEAFIEERISNGVNIVYSNENNKGKTILMQGIMYSLGNNPIFPSGFNYNNYFFYTKLTVQSKEYEFLRKKNTYIIRHEDSLQICNSETEFKYYIHKHIFSIPKITKSGSEKIVDLELFYQMFFIGQDKRNPSNVINNGYYNKQDYIDMLCYLNGYPMIHSDQYEDNKNKQDIKKYEEKVKAMKKLMKFTKNNPNLSNFINKSSDRELFESKKKILNDISKNISEYKKKRARELTRMEKLKNLITELNSLNRNISLGKVTCGNCGSDKIIYSNEDVNFEVSNKIVRSQILDSIRESIEIKEEIVKEFTNNINIEQEKFNRELKESPFELSEILIYSDEILSYEEYDNKIIELKKKIDILKNKIINSSEESETAKDKRKLMINSLLNIMKNVYADLDSAGILIFDDLFTKKDQTYSGSEEQEFYYCKLIALNYYFKHDFPIIIDSFRSGEISSKKEKIMIKEFKKLNKQIILTSTLKEEEYNNLKYEEIDNITAIDYSKHEDSKILQKLYVNEFKDILKMFNIEL
ncbi:hypothetical protein [Clostridium intestinale]|uniref:Cytoplasmic protein n=1 Tax=Clostridium intestinale URNW TaxID=1294142 RepID=U2PWP7_9CLOT|nr:hypothetical protein [Clostridium intestinale]ERK28244.1 cytoplasmic protein [Clostridium intestinale URNW]